VLSEAPVEIVLRACRPMTNNSGVSRACETLASLG
jgi:hypothetical protein